jgi:two-component system sensor histidine kinase CiaH
MTNSTDRLLVATRRRLFVVTLGLVALLVVGIGSATAVVGLRVLDADVDRALQGSVSAALARLAGELPEVSEIHESTEGPPAASDTFLLYLDASGRVVGNPSGVALTGLPDEAAVMAAPSAEDLRTEVAGGVSIRLLTVPIVASDGGAPAGYIQGGFVLTLRDRQSVSLIAAIAVVGLIGLVGAALITLLVTGRALVPIRRSLEAQRRFVADASHELRTPVALIRANAEVIEREDLATDAGRPLVEDIVAEADRLGRLVGDLLTLASTDATGLALTFIRRPVDLAELAAETVRGAAALAAQRGVRVAIDAPSAVVASADRDRLVQLILILLDNAFDHSPPDGTVTVRVRRLERSVELSVSDEGQGIPAEDRERIFEPFTHLPGVRRDRAGGTGLGLAIGRRIAVAHDGTIAADDAPGGGARFTVTLPAGGGTVG